MITLDAVLWWTVKGSLIAAIAFAATLLLRRQPAAVRHAVWAVALVAQLAVPLSGWLSPSPALAVEVPALPILLPAATPSSPSAAPATAPSRQVAPVRSADFSLSGALSALLLTGMALLLLRLVAGTVRVLVIARRSERVVDGDWLALVQRHCRALAINRPVTLLSSERVQLPVTWGFVYPVILLPEAAGDWPHELRRHVLLHELAHVRRADALTQLAAQFAVCLFWFNPLVWLAASRLRAEAENACDDYVLRDGERPSVYATTLVELVRAHHGIEPPAFASLSVGRRSELEHRVSSITHPRRDPSRRRALFAAALSAMILLVLPLSAVQRAAREASEPSSPAGTISTAIDCRPIAGPDFDFREMSGTFTDGPTTVHYFFLRPAPDRCLEASFSLNTAFTDDDRDVVPAPGLEALVHETSATFDRVVRITEADGALRRSYSIDGKPAPWDASAQQWYGSLMPEIIRRTSAGLQPRALRIVDRGGADALFDEVTAIPMTSVRRDYLAALLSLRSASEVPRARIIEAGAIALRDYEPEQANLLAEIAKREASDETVRAEVLGATGSLRDIANRKTVLDALAAHRDFAVRYAALEALPLLSGDIWKRIFLESAAPLYLGPDRELYEAFLDSANAIEDPAERELLKEALLRYDSSPEMQSRLDEWAPPGAAK